MCILFLLFILIQSLTANSIPIFGIVKDSLLNRTLEGVNVLSGSNGASTDKQGVFIIDAETEYLTISHIGFKTVEILVKDTIYVNLIRDIILSDEIVIVSSLSEQSLFNSSSSIAVIDQNDLKNHNFDHFQDAINSIPNLNFAGGTSRPRYFQIRGIGERSQFFGEGSPNHSVSYELDGIDLSGIGMIGGTIDVNNIEDVFYKAKTIFQKNRIMDGTLLIILRDKTFKRTDLWLWKEKIYLSELPDNFKTNTLY